VKQRVDFIQRISKALNKRKEEMSHQLSEQMHERVTDGVVQDSADEVLSLSMEKLQNSLQQSEIDELRHIEDALTRIQKGEYGVCIDCGEPISERRLESFPYAARCIICQEAQEQ
jgi:DnaK suppressor protein